MCCHSFSHLCVICHCFGCLMSMFQDHVTRQNFTLTKPLYVDKFSTEDLIAGHSWIQSF